MPCPQQLAGKNCAPGQQSQHQIAPKRGAHHTNDTHVIVRVRVNLDTGTIGAVPKILELLDPDLNPIENLWG